MWIDGLPCYCADWMAQPEPVVPATIPHTGGPPDPDSRIDHDLPEASVLDEARHTLGAERARGGNGRIVEADDRYLGRRVALKLMHEPGARATRFVREALITARLQHPNIVPIYDAGVRASGEPFYTMRLVPGQALRETIAAVGSLDERLALLPHVQAIADAVAYAHTQGVVHRDLTPGNVLVGPFGETVVIDWGLAKRIGEPDPGDPVPRSPLEETGLTDGLTHTGAVLGTPGYMAPEQARGEDVDARADVFAIGAILYHVLAGTPPRVGAAGPPALAGIEPGVPRDLAAIVAKAMAPSPSHRYPSAAELAADLRRFATGQLVSARRYTRWGIVRRWLARHRITVMVAAALGLALAFAVIAGTVGVVQERDRTRVERDRTRVENNRLRLLQADAVVRRDPTAAAAWLKSYAPSAERDDQAGEIAAIASSGGIARHVLTLPDGDSPSATCLSSGGRHLAIVGKSGALWLFDLEARSRRRVGMHSSPRTTRCQFMRQDTELLSWATRGDVLRVPVAGGPTTVVPFSGGPLARGEPVGDDRLLLMPIGSDVAQLVDLDERSTRPITFPPRSHLAVASPDGAAFYAVDFEGTLFRVPADGGAAAVLTKLPAPAHDLSIGDDGRLVLAASRLDLVALDTTTGTIYRLSVPFPSDPVYARATGDAVVLVAGSTLEASLWRPLTGARTHLANDAFYKTLRVQSGPQPRAFWTSSSGLVHVAELDDGNVRTLIGHHTTIRDVSVSRGGTWLATAHAEEVRVFHVPSPSSRTRQIAGGWRRVRPLRVSRQLLVTEDDHRLSIVDSTTLAVTPFETFEAAIEDMVSPVAKPWIAVCLSDGHVVLRSTADATRVDLELPGDGCQRLFTPDDDTLVAQSHSGELYEYRLPSPTPRLVAAIQGSMSFDASTDGRHLMVGSMRQISIVDRTTGAIATMADQGSPLFGFDVASKGQLAAVGLADGRVQLFDPVTRTTRTLGRMNGFVGEVQFTPDDTAVLVADESGRLARLSVTGAPPRPIGAVDVRINMMVLSDSGDRLVAADLRGELHLWDLATGGYALLRGHSTDVRGLGFIGEHVLYSFDQAGALTVWQLDDRLIVPAAPAALTAWLDAATSAVLDVAGLPRTPVRDLP